MSDGSSLASLMRASWVCLISYTNHPSHAVVSILSWTIQKDSLSLSLSCVSTAYLKRLAQIITFVRILNQLRDSISLLAEALEDLFPLLGHDGWIVDR